MGLYWGIEKETFEMRECIEEMGRKGYIRAINISIKGLDLPRHGHRSFSSRPLFNLAVLAI